MNTIMNKKRIIIISIAVLFLSIGILLSVIFVEKNNPHPNIVRPGNDIKLENITFQATGRYNKKSLQEYCRFTILVGFGFPMFKL